MTTLTLVQKVDCPDKVSDFRPIACYSILYKCITKLLSERLNQVLPEIISPSHGPFVSGRSILSNVMICQDLVRNYKKKGNVASCLMNLDLRKAYGTLSYKFLEQMLIGIGCPKKFVELVMICVTTPKFSLLLNESITCSLDQREV